MHIKLIFALAAVALLLVAVSVCEEPTSQPAYLPEAGRPTSQPTSQPALKYPWAGEWGNALYSPPATLPKLLPAKNRHGSDNFPYDLTIPIPAGLTNVEAVCLQSSWSKTEPLDIGSTGMGIRDLTAQAKPQGIVIRAEIMRHRRSEVKSGGPMDYRVFAWAAECYRRRWRECVAPVAAESSTWPVSVQMCLNGIAFGATKFTAKPFVSGEPVNENFVVSPSVPLPIVSARPPHRYVFPN